MFIFICSIPPYGVNGRIVILVPMCKGQVHFHLFYSAIRCKWSDCYIGPYGVKGMFIFICSIPPYGVNGRIVILVPMV